MSTQKERETMRHIANLIIDEASKGDVFAKGYLLMISRITRVIDDIHDQDVEVSREDLLTVLQYLFIELPVNPFFNEYRDTLLSQHVSMYNAWVASNLWEKGDETDKVYAHVWRDTVNEVVPIVALLTGGYEHMVAMSLRMRQSFKKQLGE